MTSIHDNPERGQMILRAVGETVACGEPATIGNVSEKLDRYPDFDLLDSELQEALAEMKLTPVGVGIRKRVPPAERRDSPPAVVQEVSIPEPMKGPRGSHIEPAQPALQPDVMPPDQADSDDGLIAKITREQSQHLMDVANVRLDNARIAVKVKQQDLAGTKRTLADAIMAWQQQADPLTPAERQEREKRAHLAGQQRARQQRGPNPNTAAYVAKRMTNSGNHRGAFPRQYQGRNIRSV